MINQAITSNLVKIYFFVCDKFEKELQYHCQRFSNNNNPDFTDQELVTIYLFCVNQEKNLNLNRCTVSSKAIFQIGFHIFLLM